MNWKSVSDEPEYNKTILLAWPEKRFAGESWWAKGHFDEDGWKDEDNYPLPEPPTHWFLITPPSEPAASFALAEALEKIKHMEYWYGCRLERLSQFMREEATPEIRHRYFSIIANGTADHAEPPTYAQQMNMLKHKAEGLAEALEGLLDEPCRYDHNGFCQEHYCSKPCKHEQARAALAIHRKAGE